MVRTSTLPQGPPDLHVGGVPRRGLARRPPDSPGDRETITCASASPALRGETTPAKHSGRISAYAFCIFFTVLQGLLLIPAIVIDGGNIQAMNFIIATTNMTVVLVLASIEWLFHLRERKGLRMSMIASACISVICGAATGALCILAIAHSTSLDAFVIGFIPGSPPSEHEMAVGILLGVTNSLFVFAVWALAVVLPGAVVRGCARRVEVSNLKLEAQQLRTEAELVRLRSQLEPHFLLNTLNLISGLVGSDTERARSVLVSLGDLLRDTLSEQSDVQTVAEEVHWLQRYLDVLEARHGELLQVRWFIDASARSALVPRLILQPLVENAILHGALRRKGGGIISVRVRCNNIILECEVEDDGPGLGTSRDGAIGLSNVRRRIALHCPTGTLELCTPQAGGTLATVRIPYATARDAQAES
jgi:hypothetical protein